MNQESIDVIKKMLTGGRANDLALLMEGDSKYYSGSTENIPATADESYLLRMATEHARFIGEFGFGVQNVERGGHVFTAYPEYFDAWIASGCRGIYQGDLMAYLADNPL